jgi:hypothetical protein
VALPPIAAFKSVGTIDPNQSLQRKQIEQKPELSKYHELLHAVHEAAFPRDSSDQQSRLQFEPICGEIMGEVLTQDLISGTMYREINHPFFKFATVDQCLDKIFKDVFVEKIKDKKFLVPSVTVAKHNLNKLMVSYNGLGRAELVQMLQAFSMTISEQEHKDPLKTALRGGRL